MAKGPFFNLSALDYHKIPDASFRVLSAYVPETDGIATRLDVKFGQHQFTVALPSSPPVPPQGRVVPDGELLTPSAGYVGCFNTRVSLSNFAAALEELLADIRAHCPLD